MTSQPDDMDVCSNSNRGQVQRPSGELTAISDHMKHRDKKSKGNQPVLIGKEEDEFAAPVALNPHVTYISEHESSSSSASDDRHELDVTSHLRHPLEYDLDVVRHRRKDVNYPTPLDRVPLDG